jgi:FkbM family methyltransferase
MSLPSKIKALLPEKVVQGVRHYLLQRKLDSFKKRVVEHAYLGYPLKISIQDHVAEEWYDVLWGDGSMAEIGFPRKGRRLKPGARVFDLGAHQGVVAMVLARMVGDTGFVVAVEGTKHNADVAEENRRLNGMSNLAVRHAVAAEKAGMKMSFSATLNGAVGDNLLPVEVISVSIDSLAEEYGVPDVVYVDVEGYECQVLDGGKKALDTCADFFVEVHAKIGLERFGSVQKVLSYFDDAKYDLYWSAGESFEFQPLTDRASAPSERFFLVALSK